ncbi:hypothetical protein J7M23_04145 [Candidatus Sumerlaeota bacterium]|nr:hypothetical protein [Candidatus Sumerlaeota bacterium]
MIHSLEPLKSHWGGYIDENSYLEKLEDALEDQKNLLVTPTPTPTPTPSPTETPLLRLQWTQVPNMEDGFDIESWTTIKRFPNHIVADDWLSMNSLPIVYLRWWGSYIGWMEDKPGPVDPPPIRPSAFIISWHKYSPGPPYSMPGELIYEEYCTRFTEEYYGAVRKWDDLTGTLCEHEYLYEQYLIMPFEKVADERYFVSIQAVFDVEPQFPWGWMNSESHWNDNAVYYLEDSFLNWEELIWPCGHRLEGQSMDMAFELWSPLPTPIFTPTLTPTPTPTSAPTSTPTLTPTPTPTLTSTPTPTPIPTGDIIARDADFTSPEAPAELHPGIDYFDYWVEMSNQSPVAMNDFWVEVFPSQNGGLTLLRSGISLTKSSKASLDANTPPTTMWFYQLFNWITDGVYTPVVVVNRSGTDGPPEQNRMNNSYVIVRKRIFLHNIAPREADLAFYGEPIFIIDSSSSATVTGTVRNNGSGTASSFWIEAFYGVYKTTDDIFGHEVPLCRGQYVESLSPGDTIGFSLSGPIPSYNHVVAVLIDSTNIVPETDETNNYRMSSPAPDRSGTVDLEVVSATIHSPLAPNEVHPGDTLNWEVTIRNNSPTDSGDVWLELFASRTGGATVLRSGLPLTVSEKISVPALSTCTFYPSQTIESLTDGVYTPVVMVNRRNTDGVFKDPVPSNNYYPIPGECIFLHNPDLASPSLPNLIWSVLPSGTMNGNTITVTGTVKNDSSTDAGGFWIEIYYGELTEEGIFSIAGQLGEGQKVAGLSHGATYPFSQTETVPPGSWVIAVIADATDIVPETEETDNYHLIVP